MDTHRHLDDELSSLRDRVLLLGGEAEQALERAMYALSERDSEVARQVLDHDDQVDHLEVEIDRQCIDIIALRQPAARDLRFVISVAKMAPVLERIADHACNIARAAIDLNNEPELKSVLDLSRMAEHALQDAARGARCFYFERRRHGARDHQERYRDQRSLQSHFSSSDRNDGHRTRHCHSRCAAAIRRQTSRTDRRLRDRHLRTDRLHGRSGVYQAHELIMTRPILIIEDDADISESLKYNFEREGLPAVTAPTGEAGLTAALNEREPPRLDHSRSDVAGNEWHRVVPPLATRTGHPAHADHHADGEGFRIGSRYRSRSRRRRLHHQAFFSARAAGARARRDAPRGRDDGQDLRRRSSEIDFDDIRVVCDGVKIKLTNKEFTLAFSARAQRRSRRYAPAVAG